MLTHWKSRRFRSKPSNEYQNELASETLESRDLLTAFLFVEYGDNFPSGTLATTQGALRDVANDATPANRILGPTLNDGNNAFNAGTALNIVRQTFSATERARMLAVIQRAYLPLDITVVELTATAQNLSDGRSVVGAANMNDVINTLRGGNAAFRDAYIFVATFNVGGANPTTYTGGGGTSPGNTVLDTTDLNSPTNTHDDVAVVYSAGGQTNNTLNNISHEAGHCFGLRHSITDTGVPPASALLFHQAEIMSYVNTNATTSSMFTRYPMIHGDDNTPTFSGRVTFNAAARTLTAAAGNNFSPGFGAAGSQIIVTGTASNNNTFSVQSVAANVITLVAGTVLTNETANTTSITRTAIVNYNDIAARAGQVTIYDQMRFDANIGANPNFWFVSGTGAHDIINITKNGANADVTVQAFTTAAYTTAITVPGEADTIYSFSVPLTRSLLVYGGDNNDRFIIDGDLGVTVQLDGMLGNDELIVKGKNAANAVYTPGSNNVNGVDLVLDLRGGIVLGSTSIQFVDFETAGSVTIQDVANLTLRTPLSDDSLTMASAAAGQNQITGNSDAVNIVPMTFFNVTSLTLDTGTNDLASPDDLVQFNVAIVAAGLQNLTVDTGAGADELRITLSNYALPVAGGTFRFLGGAGLDEIDATANVSFNLSDTSLGIVLDSAIGLTSVQVADLTGGASANTFTVSNWTGSAFLDGLGAGDSYIVNFVGSGAGSTDISDTGGSGSDTADVNGTASGDTMGATNSQVTLGSEDVSYSGLESLTVDAGSGDDTVNIRSTAAVMPVTVNGEDDDDIFNVGNLADSLDDILGALFLNGNSPAASDSAFVNDQGDADAHAYVITSSIVDRDGAALITYGTIELLTVNGGTGGNDINVQNTASTTPVVINAGSGDDDVLVDSNGGPISPPDGTVDGIVSSLTINGQGGTNRLYLEDFSDPGLVSGDIVHVTPTQIGADPGDSFFGAGGSITYSDLSHITMDLSNGYFPDTVYLIPSATTAFELHGNDPDCPMNPDQLPGDALFLDFTQGAEDPLLVADGNGNATWTFSNREDVVFDGFEKLNHVGIIVVAPDNGKGGVVRVYDAETGVLKYTFTPFGAGYNGGVRVAVGELNCDGIPDIITAAGPGQAPLVRVLNGVTGLPLAGTLGGFYAYDKNSKPGVWVAAADINQDGLTDIITGPDNGAGNPGPVVKVFNGETGVHLAHFLVYDKAFKGGVRVAAGDFNGDSVPDIVAAPGAGRAPLVRVYSGANLAAAPFASFFAFGQNDRKGVYVAVGDVNGDGQNDIVAGGSTGSSRIVRVFSGLNLNGPTIHGFQPYIPDPGDSIRVAVIDIDGDGDVEVVTSGGPSGIGSPKVYDFTPNPDEQENFFSVAAPVPGGYFVGAGG